MSRRRKAILGSGRVSEKVGTPTVMAVWGRSNTFNVGVGWHHNHPAAEPSPVGALVRNAQQISYGYGGASCVLTNGDVQIFGQNIGGAMASGVGPEKPWCGEWGYRKPTGTGKNGLAAQNELEAVEWESGKKYGKTLEAASGIYTNLVTEGGKTYESLKAENLGNKPSAVGSIWWKETVHKGLTAEQIEEKERELVFSRSDINGVPNSRKALPGQLVYVTGQCVQDELHAYEATAENVNKKPSSHPECWRIPSPDISVKRVESPTTGFVSFSSRRHNLVAPVKAPQVRNVKASVTAGSHTIYLLRDGTVRQVGHVVRYGCGACNYDGSMGPPPRPQLPPPQSSNRYKAIMKKGSKIVTFPPEHLNEKGEMVASIQIRQRSEPKFECGFGKATALESTVNLPEEVSIKTNSSGEGSYRVGNVPIEMVSIVSATSPTGHGTSKLVKEGSETVVKLSGWGKEEKVTVKLANTVLPSGTKLAGFTVESLPIEPPGSRGPQERVLSLELTNASAIDYEGALETRKPGKEAKFWQSGTLYRNSALWPITPVLPPGVTITAIAAASGGGSFNVALGLAQTGTTEFNGKVVPEGNVVSWGSNEQGQLGTNIPTGKEHFSMKADYVKNPEGTEPLKNIVAVACGGSTSFALDSSHRIYVWGSVDEGLGGAKLDEESKGHISLPTLLENVPTTPGKRPVAIGAASATAYFIDESGNLWVWGSNREGECGKGEFGRVEKQWKAGHAYTTGEIVYDKGSNWKAKSNVSSAVHPESELSKWEFVNHPAQPIPAEIPGLSKINFIPSGGRRHMVAVTESGNLYSWGSNENGAIGNGTEGETPVTTPFHVPFTGRKVLSAACSEFNTAALIEGTEPAAPNVVKLTLLPVGTVTGEEEGEQAAHLRIELETNLPTTGWQMKFRRAALFTEKAVIIEQLEELGAPEYGGEGLLQEVQEGLVTEEGLSKVQLEKQIEHEIESLEEELTALAGKIETINPVFTQVKPGLLRFDWTPPGPLTPNFCYEITNLNRTDSEPFQEVKIETEGLFGPYTLV